MAASTPLRYRRSLTFSVGPRVTIGRTCMTPPSFTTRAMSVASRMGAPSRRPPAKPTVQALSRCLICASVGMPDGGCETCVRRDWALAKPQSANETITTITSLGLKVIVIPSILGAGDRLCARQKRQRAVRDFKATSQVALLPAAVFSLEVRIRLQRFRSFPRLLDAGRCGDLVKLPCPLSVTAHAICLQ